MELEAASHEQACAPTPGSDDLLALTSLLALSETGSTAAPADAAWSSMPSAPSAGSASDLLRARVAHLSTLLAASDLLDEEDEMHVPAAASSTRDAASSERRRQERSMWEDPFFVDTASLPPEIRKGGVASTAAWESLLDTMFQQRAPEPDDQAAYVQLLKATHASAPSTVPLSNVSSAAQATLPPAGSKRTREGVASTCSTLPTDSAHHPHSSAPGVSLNRATDGVAGASVAGASAPAVTCVEQVWDLDPERVSLDDLHAVAAAVAGATSLRPFDQEGQGVGRDV